MKKTVLLVASGDLRLSANRVCWPAQQAAEKMVVAAFRKEGVSVRRAHGYDAKKKHGFIDSQKYGMEVFSRVDRDTPIVVVEAAWQYSHHLLHGLVSHRAPILTVANWSGQWPGLVGMLNLNGSLTKAGVKYSTLWSENFKDAAFRHGLCQWIDHGFIQHDTSHVHPARNLKLPDKALALGLGLAAELREKKAIMGIFDEGCMGMYNAIIPDELLHPTGVYKERLSQSALVAAMREVTDTEARAVRSWLDRKGMKFKTGPCEETDLTDRQILEQCKMYIAALRIADEFGCAAIGIQYQQGLKDMAPASDLVEGLLNNVSRPPARCAKTGRVLYAGEALPHFNEVDECAGLDGLVTYRLWRTLGLDPENTLHDVRWGAPYKGQGIRDYVWVFEISGAAPPKHFIGGYAGTVSERQPAMYFRLGGGTVKGISKPGVIVWSRIFVAEGRLNADVGIGKVVALPHAETERRWKATTPQWPIMHAVLPGISRDQMMARHKANHIQVAYAKDLKGAQFALAAKVAAFQAMGIETSVCGSESGLC
ncbi:MAG: fucose isomerase [Verrucomicrobiia bacterium]